MKLSRSFAVALLGFLFAAAAMKNVHAVDVPLPPSLFFSADAMSQPVLSPSGKYLAVRLISDNGRQQLAVVNLQPPRQASVVAGFSDADVAMVRWVNEDRLVFDVNDLQSVYADTSAPGLFSVDRGGQNLRSLVKRQKLFVEESRGHIVSRELEYNHRLLRVLRDGSADVMIERINFDSRRDVQSTTPLRLNTVTGRSTGIDIGLDDPVRSWRFDAKGQARAATSLVDGKAIVHWRATPDAPWEVVSSGAAFAPGPGSFRPWSIGADGHLYAVAQRSGDDRTDALFRFDPGAKRLEPEPIVDLQGFDFAGHLIFNEQSGKLLGVRYTSDATATAWFDADLQALQARLDKRLPGLINLIDDADCGCSRWLVVTSYSDRQSPLYSLYDRSTDQLERIGQARPGLDAGRMARRDLERIKARDGLSLPVHITRPPGTGPWPAVILVHGGPYVRGGSWRWDASSQFLASRGFLVVEPEFRGSTGYGARLFRAGWKQWGLGMQNDVADATRWAIAKGLADPGRICIAGASYGGYATLMGLIRDPDLYRCGVAWAAVTDINLMYDLHWSDFSEVWKQYGMPLLIGDQTRDAAQFAATSPLKQAARIKQPLLLAYGGSDRRVPIEHGTRFRDALRETNPQVEWVVYSGEGHGWSKPENRYDFWSRVEQFLARQLAPSQ